MGTTSTVSVCVWVDRFLKVSVCWMGSDTPATDPKPSVAGVARIGVRIAAPASNKPAPFAKTLAGDVPSNNASLAVLMSIDRTSSTVSTGRL